MNQFIYTEEDRIINARHIIYMYIEIGDDGKYRIKARMPYNIISQPIQTCDSEDEAIKAMHEIMVALATRQSYTVRQVNENDT